MSTPAPSDRPLRVAAIDCGTNSLRLLVSQVVPPPGTPSRAGAPATGVALADVERRVEVVRLGEGVDATGELAPAALERTLAVTAQYARRIAELGASRVRFVATSATRDASNAAELVSGVRALLGTDPEVISGEEEARLSFDGAVTGVGSEHPAPHLVVDLGGGSTEFVLGGPAGGGAGGPAFARSTDVGCVRLRERHLVSDPPTPAQLAAARADVRAALDVARADVPLERAATLVGVAGTVTTITAHALQLDRYDPAALHGAVLPAGAVLAACDDLVAMPRAQRAALPFMHPGRVDVIAAGALLWREVVAAVVAASGLDRVVTSEHDILDGIAADLARRTPSP